MQASSDALCEYARPINLMPQDVKEQEFHLLMQIDFDLRLATSRRFFEILANKVRMEHVHRLFGEFLLEVALFEAEQLRQNDDSLLALAALLLVSMRIWQFHQSTNNRDVLNRVRDFIENRQDWYTMQDIERRANSLERSEYQCMKSPDYPSVSLKYTGQAAGLQNDASGPSLNSHQHRQDNPLMIIRPLIAPAYARYVFY